MAEQKPRLLLIDDGEVYARTLARRMREFELVDPESGLGQPRLPDGPSALEFLGRRSDDVDVVLLDMRFDLPEDRLLPLPEAPTLRRRRRFQGVAILRALRERWPDLPVVLLTSVEDLELVDAAEELAALSMTYVLDGDDLETLRIRIHTALQDAARALAEADVLWGKDQAMRAVRRRLSVLARGRLTVILEGATGTGKSFLAERFVHARSGRTGPFVVLDLATVPTDLIPAHLFGATRGAYTGAVSDRKGVFELADKGTLFIDEVQNAPLEVQKQLLLVLQDRKVRPLGSSREIEVDVKVVAASNESLADGVRSGRFRPDLYMRLGPATRVELPPLCARPGDLDFLARRFVRMTASDPDIASLRDSVAATVGLPPQPDLRMVVGREDAGTGVLQLAIPEPAWRRLTRHPWPGNLRELSMVMHNLVTFTLVAAVDAIEMGAPVRTPRLQVDTGLVSELLAGAAPLPDTPDSAEQNDPDLMPIRLRPAPTLNAVSTSVERQYFLHLFRQSDGDFAKMADRLLGDSSRGRAIRLRFNQLGLKVRDLRRG